MIAQNITPTVDKQTLLRRTLQADGIFEIVCGLGLALVAEPLTKLFGMDSDLAWLLMLVGVSLIGVGGFMLWLAAQPKINLSVAIIIAVINELSALVIAVVLIAGWLPITVGGAWLLGFVAADLMLFAILEYLGFQRAKS
jgi:uncharacterized iron-regulated membrane protein